MKKILKQIGKFEFGGILMVLGFFLLVLPPLLPSYSLQPLAIGLGISHRPTYVTVGANGISSFEVAKVQNTGDEIYILNTKWTATGGILKDEVIVNVYPERRVLYPNEAFTVIGKITAPNSEGDVVGTVELIPERLAEPPSTGDVMGTVLPGAELEFDITVTKMEQAEEPTLQDRIALYLHSINAAQDILGVVTFITGFIVVVKYRRTQ